MTRSENQGYIVRFSANIGIAASTEYLPKVGKASRAIKGMFFIRVLVRQWAKYICFVTNPPKTLADSKPGSIGIPQTAYF